MKYNIEIRSIASQEQSIEDKHSKFLDGIKGLAAPWSAANRVDAPDAGSGLTAILRASKIFGKGVSGNIVYQFRRSFQDNASQDDYIDISINPENISYNELVYNVFLKYARSFDAYYADISDDEFIYMDFDKRRELRIDSRRSVYRISPVSYWSDGFCQSSFNLSPMQIVDRLIGKVEFVEEAFGGVFIVLTSQILPIEDVDTLCWQAKSYL